MRLFAWSGVMILVTGLVAGATGWLLSDGPTAWQRTMRGASVLACRRFADVWGRPAERAALAHEIATELDVGVATFDASGVTLDRAGVVRGAPSHSFPISRGGEPLGRVELFVRRGRGPGHVLAPLGVALLSLWALSGLLARRLSRPLSDLAATAEAIGRGELDRRTRVARHAPREVARVAEAMDDMAARIQRQMADSRELLAAVSHEVRSPLARIRLLVELARSSQDVTPSTRDEVTSSPQIALGEPDGSEPEVTSSGPELTSSALIGDLDAARALTEIEREVEDIDALVGSLLAGSRLDFGTKDLRDVDPVAATRDALARAGLPTSLLEAPSGVPLVSADPTLLSRALANLLDNARIHGGGAVRLGVEHDEALRIVRFCVEDRGPGLGPDAERMFQAFHRQPGTRGALGLSLSIVARIAEAHGGSAFAEDRPQGGSRVGFTFPTASGGRATSSRGDGPPRQPASGP